MVGLSKTIHIAILTDDARLDSVAGRELANGI